MDDATSMSALFVVAVLRVIQQRRSELAAAACLTFHLSPAEISDLARPSVAPHLDTVGDCAPSVFSDGSDDPAPPAVASLLVLAEPHVARAVARRDAAYPALLRAVSVLAAWVGVKGRRRDRVLDGRVAALLLYAEALRRLPDIALTSSSSVGISVSGSLSGSAGHAASNEDVIAAVRALVPC
jgi:hypothetical protein